MLWQHSPALVAGADFVLVKLARMDPPLKTLAPTLTPLMLLARTRTILVALPPGVLRRASALTVLLLLMALLLALRMLKLAYGEEVTLLPP